MMDNTETKIQQLIAQANKAYALANYEEAADKYAQASEASSLEYGEENPKNADVLFLYGRTLFKLAMQKSEVLGGGGGEVAGNGAAATPNSGKPLKNDKFSFEGDDDADEDEEAENPAAASGNAEEEDHFQAAWEVLDLARLSCQKQLDSNEATDKKTVRQRLADLYDILGEIALENENFDQAVSDLKTALSLKQEVYEANSSQISGAHYMLALALEYCTSSSSREAAAQEVQLAIKCFEHRIAAASAANSDTKDEKEMLQELKLKLSELEAPPVAVAKEDLTDIFGKEGGALKESLVQAMQSSNDLSNLVRKKDKKRPVPESTAQPSKKTRIEEVADEAG